MSTKRRILTKGTQPAGRCPHCGGSVVKAIVLGKLSYICNVCRRAGTWDSRTPEMSVDRHNASS